LQAILIIAVCAAVLYTHWPALSAKALSFDDNQYLTENPLVQNPGWTSAKRFLTEILRPSTVEGYYQPLAMISLMLDYSLGGSENNLLPFHRTSLILHIANTALIIVLLYLLFGQIWIAAGVGLLFGVHPMTVEPVPWVGERKTLLAAFFSLWSLIFYVYSRTTQNARRKTALLYVGSFVAYLLALMSKPTSTPLPAVMLLLDYWPLRRLNWRAVLEKVPLFILGGASAVITYISQSRTASTVLPGQFGPERIPLILCHNIIFYLYKMIWPVNLTSHYAFPEPLNLSQPMVLAGVIGTCILIPLLVLSLRWTRAALTGWLIFFVAILPTMQIIGFSNVIASDKYAYLPSIGLLIALTAFLIWLCNTRPLALCRVAVAIILISACAESIAARRYLVYWQDTIRLFERMLTLTPNAVPVYNDLGMAFYTKGRLDDAITHYLRALQLSPYDVEIHINLGNALYKKGSLNEAISHFNQALLINPKKTQAYNNLAIILTKQDKLDEAADCYRRLLKLKPDDAETSNALANILSKQGRFDEAIDCYQQALSIKPDAADIHYNFGITLGTYGKLDAAADHFRQALRLKPDYADACYNLARVLQFQKKLDEAISYYQQAINLNPNFPKAHNNLGTLLAAQNRFDEAIFHFQQALKLKPDYADAHYNLGRTFQSQGSLNDALNHYRQALQIDPNHTGAGEAYLKLLESLK
jgi:tetratricopeptide (TPR) repeat protein